MNSDDSKIQLIKTRDDQVPVRLFRCIDEPDSNRTQFKVSSDSKCSWARSGSSIGPEVLRPRIEPWLTSLVQSEHLSLLVGSGLTHAVHGLATDDQQLPGMSSVEFAVLKAEIDREANRTADLARRAAGNFEDQIRAANELLRGLAIVAATQPTGAPECAEVSSLEREIGKALDAFARSVLSSEYSIVSAEARRREEAFNYLVSFLMSFASRTGTRGRLQLFTTNYDRLLEAGADVAGLRLVDRFVGALSPVFRTSRIDVDLHYDPPGIRGEPRYLEGVARFTKLHGSVDWLDHDGAIRRVGLPFGATDTRPYLAVPGVDQIDVTRMMIYPNAAKDRETASYPYVELFRDFAVSLCRPNSTLVCYGYGFGDEHINRVIEDMLTIPSTHLVVVSYDDPLGRIMHTYEKLGRHAQVTLVIGDHLGDLRSIVDHYLPKPAIDRTTFRMAKLLKARLGTLPNAEDDRDAAVLDTENIIP